MKAFKQLFIAFVFIESEVNTHFNYFLNSYLNSFLKI